MTRRDRARKSVSDSVSGAPKIAKLLRLAADPAAFEGERAVALRKAADLTERAQPSTPRVTEKNVDSLPAPESGSVIYRETGIAGLGLRVTAAGARAWTLDYVCAGRQRRYTVGPRHAFTLKAATIEAKRLHGLIAQGIDPFDVKAEREAAAAARLEAERAAADPNTDPTVAHLAKRWLADYADQHLRPNSRRTARNSLKRIEALKFDRKKIREVTRRDVQALMKELRETPIAANRTRSFLSTIFNYAIANGIGLTEANVNPARRVKGSLVDNAEPPRKVIVPSQKQIDALHAALDARAEYPSAAAIRLLLLTGARKSEVLGLEWQEIDDLLGDNPAWTLPPERAKQKKARWFPLADPQVLGLLRRLYAKTGRGKYVFPSALCPGAPLKDINALWYSVRDAAGLSRFRLHDLRHVFVSRGLNTGESIFAVGELVGHSSAYMTARYGHLDNRTAAEVAKRIGSGLAPTKPSAPIPAETNGASA